MSLFSVSVSFSGVADGGQFDDSMCHSENVKNDNGTLYYIENGADAPSVCEISKKKDCVDNQQKKCRVHAVRALFSSYWHAVRTVWQVVYTKVNSNVDNAKEQVHCNCAIHNRQ